MNVIILCGGLSTRLGEITKQVPKVLLPIGDRTVLDWQLEHVKSIGVTEVVLAAGHLSDVLRREVGDERHGVRMVYAVEPERLGTGGAIKYAWSFVRDATQPTFILNGDILTTIAFRDMLQSLKPESDGLILGARVSDASSYGTLAVDAHDKLISFKEKEGIRAPGYINGGIYLFTPQAKKYFPEQAAFSVEYDVFPHMTDLYVYRSDAAWIDVGVPDRLDWARTEWRQFLQTA